MKNLINKNIIFGFLIGLIVMSGISVLANNYLYSSEQISYNDKNIKQSLDELYNNTRNLIDTRFGGFSITYNFNAANYGYETIYKNESYGIILNTLGGGSAIIMTSNNSVNVTNYSKMKITYWNYTSYVYGTEFMLLTGRTNSSSPTVIKTTGRVNSTTTPSLYETEIDLSDINQDIYLAIKNIGSGTSSGNLTHVIGIELIV